MIELGILPRKFRNIGSKRKDYLEKFKTRHKRGPILEYLTLIKECVSVVLCLSSSLFCVGKTVMESTVFGMGVGWGREVVQERKVVSECVCISSYFSHT